MNIKDEAQEILHVSQEIYQIEEQTNPTAIFKDNVFTVMADGEVFVERDCEKQDSSYYFETPEIDGVIIKRVNGNYCIKASVKYKDSDNRDLWFAKIRIENFNGDIQIMGSWGGSWQQADNEDEDLTKEPSTAFLLALASMKEHLANIYGQLHQNNGLNSDLYDSGMVKQLKMYNK